MPIGVVMGPLRATLVFRTESRTCSGSGVLLEAIHNGTAPAGIVTSRLDPVIALGCILGDELYACHPPLLVISDRERLLIETGDAIEIDDSGFITITKA